MEPVRKRMCSVYLPPASEMMPVLLDQHPIQDGGGMERSSTSKFINVQNMIDNIGDLPNFSDERKIQDTLDQLEQDVTCIKTSLEKRKPKVTLGQLNKKIDTILEILNEWNTCREIRDVAMQSNKQ